MPTWGPGLRSAPEERSHAAVLLVTCRGEPEELRANCFLSAFGQSESLKALFDQIGVSEMASAKVASAIGVRIDDVGSRLKYRFPFGEHSACFCQSVWLPGSILHFRIGSVSSIGGLIAATLFADTVSGF